MKFLLAVDGSNCSIRAAEYLAGHLDLFNIQPELHLVNVHAPVASARVRSYVGKEALDKYYGTAEAFKTLVDECHQRNIAVILDVVFNQASGASSLMRWIRSCT